MTPALDPEPRGDPEDLDDAEHLDDGAAVRRPGPLSAPEEPVLPGQTSDDLDADWRDREAGEESPDDRYLRERPPHW